MEPVFSALVIGGNGNDSAIRICRELIFKYGIKVINADYWDARDDILYGLEEYYRSDDVRSDKWILTFDSHINLINDRKKNYEFVNINTQNWKPILSGVNVVINLTQYYEPTIGGLLSTPIQEVDPLINLWCHMIEIMETIRLTTHCTIVYLINKDTSFNRGWGILANSTLQLLDGKLSVCQENYDVYFSLKELFQQFENGTYADIMR
ncbi:Srl4 [Kluyveromyces lactis]|nr:Srl4 [Kluyveromyces lactis]